MLTGKFVLLLQTSSTAFRLYCYCEF